MITKEQALECLEDMDDFARMADIEPIGAYKTLKQFIEEHYQDSLRWKKVQELDLDVGVLYAGKDMWFEFYDAAVIDELILEDNNAN